ncbi:MAG: trimeric intracellular cation channel family protein [Clostridiales bacterium]|jgi:uncharacterized membrane protein YeiH|nr:trimeric intracellular cation channel family protein [Clostridiales bacterium]
MQVFQVLEYIGLFAFALNGAFVGIEYKFDYFGIPFLAIIASLGGGIVRDLCLGNTPPMAFRDPVYILLAIGVAAACIVFYVFFRKKMTVKNLPVMVTVINVFDAVGLAVFTVSGAQIALRLLPDMEMMQGAHALAKLILVVFVAVTSAIGGGMIRDVIANRKPLVLRKEIYAIASILGAVLYYFLVPTILGQLGAALISIALILSVRFVAMRKKINLPHFADNTPLLRRPERWKQEIPFEGEADDADDNHYF